MQAIIIHGWKSDSNDNWFPWLKKQLEARGLKVACPDLPNAENPKQEEWISVINDEIDEEEELILIGHSLGTVAALSLLERIKTNCKATILVAGFTQSFGVKEIADFFKTSFDWQLIKKHSKKFFVISSDNDPYLPLAEGEKLAERVNAEWIIEKNAGHIDVESGFSKYERILEIIKGMI